jgi:hypothetical protein
LEFIVVFDFILEGVGNNIDIVIFRKRLSFISTGSRRVTVHL